MQTKNICRWRVLLGTRYWVLGTHEPLRLISRFRLAVAGVCAHDLRPGVMEIRSATMHTKFAGSHVKQIYWVVAGVGMMFLISLVNYQALLDRIHWFYIAAIASLMAVMIFGQKYLGAKRWIKMPGGNHFQPSEWVKLILILAMAKFFADLRNRELPGRIYESRSHRSYPMLLVLKQPDLGTALTYIPIAIMGVFLGGMQWKQGLLVAVLAGIGVGAVFFVPGFTFLRLTRSSG